MNRILIKVYVPQLEKKYDVWIPINRTIYTITVSLMKGISSLNKIEFDNTIILNLYNKENSEQYEPNKKIIETDIRNGSELIMF